MTIDDLITRLEKEEAYRHVLIVAEERAALLAELKLCRANLKHLRQESVKTAADAFKAAESGGRGQ